MAGFECFQKELCAVLCLEEDERWPLTESLFFWKLNSEIFAGFFPFKIDFDWWNCAFWLMIKCTGLWLTCCCDTFFCRHDCSFFCGCFLVACYYCFQSFMLFSASRKRLALTESLFFWRPKNLDFLYFAASVPCFNRLRLWWNCAFWIDDNMHWALIDLFCDIVFVYNSLGFSAVALNWLATSVFKKLYAIFCLKETPGFDWVCFFGDLKFRFSSLCCLCSVF